MNKVTNFNCKTSMNAILVYYSYKSLSLCHTPE